jgi:hypothetical protein
MQSSSGRKPVVFKVSEPYVAAVMYKAHDGGSIRIVVYLPLNLSFYASIYH